MAMRKGGGYVEGAPKKTRQGAGSHTKYAASSRNKARKKYRGQGKGWYQEGDDPSFFMKINTNKG